jgi:hypothetical protein
VAIRYMVGEKSCVGWEVHPNWVGTLNCFVSREFMGQMVKNHRVILAYSRSLSPYPLHMRRVVEPEHEKSFSEAPHVCAMPLLGYLDT